MSGNLRNTICINVTLTLGRLDTTQRYDPVLTDYYYLLLTVSDLKLQFTTTVRSLTLWSNHFRLCWLYIHHSSKTFFGTKTRENILISSVNNLFVGSKNRAKFRRVWNALIVKDHISIKSGACSHGLKPDLTLNNWIVAPGHDQLGCQWSYLSHRIQKLPKRLNFFITKRIRREANNWTAE